MITKSGVVYQCYGDINNVDPYGDLGEIIRGSSITHNHPIGSINEYSFSKLDMQLFENYDLDVLRGVDEKYIYELLKNNTYVDKPISIFEMGDFDYQHNVVIDFAIQRCYGYKRVGR